MNILDDLNKIRKIDKSSVLDSASLLPDQIRQAWEEIYKLKIPLTRLKKVKNIVVAGMGGSALGARIIDSLSFEVLDLPLEIVNGYHLPAYADENSLTIISSYSGNTEETLHCCQEAIKRKCQIFVISTGGELIEFVDKHKLPAYIFQPRYNPSKQARMGLGYSITGQLAFLSRLGFVRFDKAQITEVINYLNDLKLKYVASNSHEKNPAKKYAVLLRDKIMVLVASEHLDGANHTFKNMINENSKAFAVKFDLPEMNHHLLEGLINPADNKKWLEFLFLESDFYSPEIQKRIKITRDVVEKNGIPCLSLKMEGRTRLIQVFEVIYISEFISAYLAILYGFDPAPIPWVDYFKDRLAAHEEKR